MTDLTPPRTTILDSELTKLRRCTETLERVRRELRRIGLNSVRPPVYMIREMESWCSASLAPSSEEGT